MKALAMAAILAASVTSHGQQVVAPTSGAATIKLPKATWCGSDVEIKFRKPTQDRLDREFKKFIKNAGKSYKNTVFEAVSNAGRAACGKPADPYMMALVQSVGQTLANEHGVNQEQVVLAFRVLSRLSAFKLRDYGNYAPEECKNYQASKRAGRIERNQANLFQAGLDCSAPSSADWMLWDLDRGPKIDSQIKLAGWLYTAFGHSRGVNSFATGIMAWRDLKHFRPMQFLKEMEQKSIPDKVKLRAVLRMHDMLKSAGKWKAYYAEELGKEDFQALTKTFDTTYDKWVSEYQKNKEAIDYAWDIEEKADIGDKRKFKGCSEKTKEFATKFIMERRPKSIEDINKIASEPMGVLILSAAFVCEKTIENKFAAAAYSAFLKEAPASRGPRFAAKLAVARKVAEIKENVSRFPLRVRDFKPSTGDFGKGYAGWFNSGRGVVKRIKKKGDQVTISFKKERWKEPIWSCKETRRVDRITADGKIVYRQNCKKKGYKKVSSQEKPVTIPASTAAHIKRGTFVIFARDRESPNEGFPKYVYKHKKQKNILSYYGISLK